jgi:hypothetical protein
MQAGPSAYAAKLEPIMRQSQDIGNVRRELILKVLSAQRTKISLLRQIEGARCQREVLEGSRARIQTQKRVIERLTAVA